jgi:hypothetical protein
MRRTARTRYLPSPRALEGNIFPEETRRQYPFVLESRCLPRAFESSFSRNGRDMWLTAPLGRIEEVLYGQPPFPVDLASSFWPVSRLLKKALDLVPGDKV